MLPKYVRLFLTEDFTHYSTSGLQVTWLFGLVLSRVAGPVVEKLYFRRYLLARISRPGARAPHVNTVPFSLYHSFTPWQNVGRVLGLLPIVEAACRSGAST